MVNEKVENVHSSAGNVHCSVPIEDPKYNACDSETLEKSDVLEHYLQLFIGIQEVSSTGPNHSLLSGPKRWESRKR